MIFAKKTPHPYLPTPYYPHIPIYHYIGSYTPLTPTPGLASVSANVKVLRQRFRTRLFPNPIMYVVHVWFDVRYWSKLLRSTIRSLKGQVTDLELLC